VNISTIKPLDTASLKKYCNGMKGVVTAEEHNIYCGLGSAVAEALSASRLPIGMVAIHDSFGTSAKQYEELLTSYGLQPKNIIDKVKEVLSV